MRDKICADASCRLKGEHVTCYVYRGMATEVGNEALRRAFKPNSSDEEYRSFIERLGLSDGDALFVSAKQDRHLVSYSSTELG